jgi:signal transduction histidine kinase
MLPQPSTTNLPKLVARTSDVIPRLLAAQVPEQSRNEASQLRAAAERCRLVLFEMAEMLGSAEQHRSSLSVVETADSRARELTRLGKRLYQNLEDMDTLVLQHECTLEELQSTAEKALSNNEDLQRLIGQLRSAQEELQSANAALATRNQELQDRNAQFARSNHEIQRKLDDANAIVEAVPQPLAVLDSELRVERANLAFLGMFEMTAERSQEDRSLPDIDAGHWAQPAVLAALRDVLIHGGKVEKLAVEAEFSRIGFRNMFVNAQRLQFGGDTGGRVLLAIDDRTAVTRAERGREAVLDLEQNARKRAEAADRLKDQWVATVSHELRGPLAVISGWTNLLQGAGKNPDSTVLAKALTAIGRSVTAQTRLLSDLLDHSRIVTGKTELRREPIDLLTVAESALVGVQAPANAKDIQLLLSGHRATSIILGDSDRMQQVLWNLLLNAVKFTPRGGRVWVSVGRVGSEIQITVRDNGRGIAADFLPYVFERFRQDGSNNRAQQGLGLGLTLVRELVELHGGTVRAASPGQDQGATFTVVLPIPTSLLGPPEPGTHRDAP